MCSVLQGWVFSPVFFCVCKNDFLREFLLCAKRNPMVRNRSRIVRDYICTNGEPSTDLWNLLWNDHLVGEFQFSCFFGLCFFLFFRLNCFSFLLLEWRDYSLSFFSLIGCPTLWTELTNLFIVQINKCFGYYIFRLYCWIILFSFEKKVPILRNIYLYTCSVFWVRLNVHPWFL